MPHRVVARDVVAFVEVGDAEQLLERVGQPAPAGARDVADALRQPLVEDVLGVVPGAQQARDAGGVDHLQAGDLGLSRHLVEIEADGLERDGARDVVGPLHQEQDVAAAGQHAVDAGEALHGALAAQSVVLDDGVLAGALQQLLEARRVALAVVGLGIIAEALGDAVAEGDVAGLRGGG
jgi:hypothetical protein